MCLGQKGTPAPKASLSPSIIDCLGLKQGYGDLEPNHIVKYISQLWKALTFQLRKSRTLYQPLTYKL